MSEQKRDDDLLTRARAYIDRYERRCSDEGVAPYVTFPDEPFEFVWHAHAPMPHEPPL